MVVGKTLMTETFFGLRMGRSDIAIDQEAGLGCIVASKNRRRNKRKKAADVDDLTSAILCHGFRERSAHRERSVEIGGKVPIKSRFRRRQRALKVENPSVIVQKGYVRLYDGISDLSRACEVELQTLYSRAVSSLERRKRGGVPPRREYGLGPRIDQCIDKTTTEPSIGAGY